MGNPSLVADYPLSSSASPTAPPPPPPPLPLPPPPPYAPGFQIIPFLADPTIRLLAIVIATPFALLIALALFCNLIKLCCRPLLRYMKPAAAADPSSTKHTSIQRSNLIIGDGTARSDAIRSDGQLSLERHQPNGTPQDSSYRDKHVPSDPDNDGHPPQPAQPPQSVQPPHPEPPPQPSQLPSQSAFYDSPAVDQLPLPATTETPSTQAHASRVHLPVVPRLQLPATPGVFLTPPPVVASGAADTPAACAAAQTAEWFTTCTSMLTVEVKELVEERQRRLDWISFYVQKGEYEKATELGWNGVPISVVMDKPPPVDMSSAEPTPPPLILRSPLVQSPPQAQQHQQLLAISPGRDAFITAARVHLRRTGRTLTPRSTNTPRIIGGGSPPPVTSVDVTASVAMSAAKHAELAIHAELQSAALATVDQPQSTGAPAVGSHAEAAHVPPSGRLGSGERVKQMQGAEGREASSAVSVPALLYSPDAASVPAASERSPAALAEEADVGSKKAAASAAAKLAATPQAPAIAPESAPATTSATIMSATPAATTAGVTKTPAVQTPTVESFLESHGSAGYAEAARAASERRKQQKEEKQPPTHAPAAEAAARTPGEGADNEAQLQDIEQLVHSIDKDIDAEALEMKQQLKLFEELQAAAKTSSGAHTPGGAPATAAAGPETNGGNGGGGGGAAVAGGWRVNEVPGKLRLGLDPGGEMPDGVHEDKLGTFLPVDEAFAATWQLPSVMTNERRCYSKEGDTAARLMIWWSGGRWWVGKRAELGLPRGWVKVMSDEVLPPRKGWAVLSAKAKPAKWKDATDVSCDRLGMKQSPRPNPQPEPQPPLLAGVEEIQPVSAGRAEFAPSEAPRQKLSVAPSEPPPTAPPPALAPTPSSRGVQKAAAEPSPRHAGGAPTRLKSQTHFGKLFREVDVDGSGSLTREELAVAMKARTNLSDAELDEFFAVTDRNGDGKLTALEAIKGFKTLHKEGKLTSLMADVEAEEELGA